VNPWDFFLMMVSWIGSVTVVIVLAICVAAIIHGLLVSFFNLFVRKAPTKEEIERAERHAVELYQDEVLDREMVQAFMSGLRWSYSKR
jgi:MFS superfamily sulfate permease-like transporter